MPSPLNPLTRNQASTVPFKPRRSQLRSLPEGSASMLGMTVDSTEDARNIEMAIHGVGLPYQAGATVAATLDTIVERSRLDLATEARVWPTSTTFTQQRQYISPSWTSGASSEDTTQATTRVSLPLLFRRPLSLQQPAAERGP
jgi:hypothetical protein